MIDISFELKRDFITIPINPDHIKVNVPGKNQKANVIGIGEIVVLRTPGLATFDIDSFLPDDSDVEEYISFFEEWQDRKQPAHFTADGLDIDMKVGLEEFTYERRAGEEGRVYYQLSLTEYRPYGAKVVAMPTATTATPPAPPRAAEKPAAGRSYTVVYGDTLWGLARRFSNQNGADWKKIYDLNKEVIGSDPNRIYVGWVFTMPPGW